MGLQAICSRCGTMTENIDRGLCKERCAPLRNAADQRRRMAKPQRQVWDDPRWAECREIVKKRDGYTCTKCGRHRSELGENEHLIADHHPIGVMALLEHGLNPFDPRRCRTLCSLCSGQEDGGR